MALFGINAHGQAYCNILYLSTLEGKYREFNVGPWPVSICNRTGYSFRDDVKNFDIFGLREEIEIIDNQK